MRKYSKSSIKSKNLIVICGVGFFIIVFGVLSLNQLLRITIFSNTSKIAKLQCQDAGEKLSMIINSSADIIRNYSYLIAHVVETDLIPKENKREFVLTEMEVRFINEKALNNLWCTFEPDALDGMDASFVNRMGSDEKGVFNPMFTDDKTIAFSLDDYVADYYTMPKKTKKEAISDPYWYDINGKETLMISFSAPILLNDVFLGVLGTDFYIHELDELITYTKLVGNSELITDKGVIIIHDNPELIGTSVDFDVNDLQNKLTEEKVFDEFQKSENGDIYRVFVPVYFGEISAPWYYIVEVPARQIYAEDRKMISLLAIIFILIALSIFFYVKTVEKNRELNKLHTVKDKLFSVVAHDLRSPIASLVSMLELVKMKTLDQKKQTAMLHNISKRVEDVYRLLDNLLRWAKSQMQGIVLSPVYLNVQEEVNEVISNVQNVAAAKKIALINHIKKQEVFADRDMLSVTVRNLVSNAIKFTAEGGEITIESEMSGDKLVVSVVDNGTGMTPEILNNLFELTKTKSILGTNNESGLGLGLLLCYDFVKANGGKIWAVSKQGEGSKFSFSIPLKKRKVEKKPRAKRENAGMDSN